MAQTKGKDGKYCLAPRGASGLKSENLLILCFWQSSGSARS